jgi:hypothetical protein
MKFLVRLTIASTKAGILPIHNVGISATGHIPSDEVDGSVKVVRVDGRLPGEPGYRLTLVGR